MHMAQRVSGMPSTAEVWCHLVARRAASSSEKGVSARRRRAASDEVVSTEKVVIMCILQGYTREKRWALRDFPFP